MRVRQSDQIMASQTFVIANWVIRRVRAFCGQDFDKFQDSDPFVVGKLIPRQVRKPAVIGNFSSTDKSKDSD